MLVGGEVSGRHQIPVIRQSRRLVRLARLEHAASLMTSADAETMACQTGLATASPG